jgi:hypothetical protein
LDVTTEPAAADNAGQQSEAVATDTPPQADLADTLIGRLRAKFGKQPDASEPTTSEPEPTAEAAATETPAADAAETKVDEAPAEPEPEKPPAKKDDGLELKHARALAELERTKVSELKQTKAAEAALARAKAAEDKLEELRAKAKKNPLKVMEELSEEQFAAIMAKAGKGEYDVPEPQALPPEVQAELDYVKELRKEREEQRKVEARKADMAADLPKVQKFLEVGADKFPTIASFDGAANDVLEMYYDALDRSEKTGAAKPNLDEMLADAEQTARANYLEGFTNVKLVKHMISADPKVRTLLIEALGLTEQNPAGPASGSQGDPKQRPATAKAPDSSTPTPPRTVATHTEAPARTPGDELSEDELRAERIRLFRQAIEAGNLRF